MNYVYVRTDPEDILNELEPDALIDWIKTNHGKGVLLDSLTAEDCIDHFGKSEFLDSIGSDYCCNYFGLAEEE